MATKELNTHQEQGDIRAEKLTNIISCLYASGCRLEDYNKFLLYLQTLIPNVYDKENVIKNWTAPYMESMINFFCELKKDTELMEANRDYIKY